MRFHCITLFLKQYILNTNLLIESKLPYLPIFAAGKAIHAGGKFKKLAHKGIKC
jgi:hypothetical protein